MVIKTLNLVKKYKDLVAVNDVSLEISEQECFGLLGPNGAGKTSLVRMIICVSPPTGGDAWVMDMNVKTQSRQIKGILGVAPQHENLDPDLTVMKNLLVFARYFDIPKAEAHRRSAEVLKLFELQNKAESKIDELSGGMKRRLLLARAMINNPKVLVLDEPTVGLDPQSKYLVWNKLKELKSQGVAQLMCTQNMDEAAALCDRVAIMHQGKVLNLDTPQSLIKRYIGDELWEVDVKPETRQSLLDELKTRGLEFDAFDGRIQIFHVGSDEPLNWLRSLADGFRHRPATLEDVFLRLTGRSLSE